jgi:hypothetical protein
MVLNTNTNTNINNNNNTNNTNNFNSINENLNLNSKLANMLKLSMNNATANVKPILPSTMNQIGSLSSKQLEENNLSSGNSGGGGGKILSNEDKKINLNALKNQDPFATNIIDTALRVAVYKFVSKKNEWVKRFFVNSFFYFRLQKMQQRVKRSHTTSR